MAPQSQLGPIKYGFDLNGWYREFTITSATFGGDSADGYLGPSDGYAANGMPPFSTQGAIFAIVSPATSPGVVAYSFNGTTEHGRLYGSGANIVGRSTLTFDNRVIGKIWFRLVSGSSTTVSVEAWSIR